MILVTTHAIDHWLDRCRGLRFKSNRATRQHVSGLVKDGRMSTPYEAKCLTLWLDHGATLATKRKKRFIDPERFMINGDLAFLLQLNSDCGHIVVMTCLKLSTAMRFCDRLFAAKSQDCVEV